MTQLNPDCNVNPELIINNVGWFQQKVLASTKLIKKIVGKSFNWILLLLLLLFTCSETTKITQILVLFSLEKQILGKHYCKANLKLSLNPSIYLNTVSKFCFFP